MQKPAKYEAENSPDPLFFLTDSSRQSQGWRGFQQKSMPVAARSRCYKER
jgi:hypothetical protein